MAVTMLRVLTHTSGLPNWRGPAESLRAGGCDGAAGTEVLRFERDPGSFGYSGEGFELLLHALGRRADRAPVELLDGLLRQFGMADSSFVWLCSPKEPTRYFVLACCSTRFTADQSAGAQSARHTG